MTTETPIELWWPDPRSFDDLTVEDAEGGFTLSAPDDTECGQWLAFWNQDEEHHKVLEREFVAVLTHYANKTLEEHGEIEAIAHEQSNHRVETEENPTGEVS